MSQVLHKTKKYGISIVITFNIHNKFEDIYICILSNNVKVLRLCWPHQTFKVYVRLVLLIHYLV